MQPQPKQIALKIQYEKDIRRVSANLPLTWNELQNILKRVFQAIPQQRWNQLVVRFQDDEGDFCTVSSDDELREAIFLSPPSDRPLLKLELFAISGNSRNSLEKSVPRVLPLARLIPATKPQPEASKDTERCVPKVIPLTRLTPALPKPPTEETATPQKTSQTLQDEALILMDANDFVAAREMFVEQLSCTHRPWHRSIPLYNIACCDSRLGDFESAFIMLEKAIRNGFTDCDHMKADPDLDNIKSNPRFAQLLDQASQLSSRAASRRDGTMCGFRRRAAKLELQGQALNLMEMGGEENLILARDLLNKQLQLCIFPWGRRIPLYNLACCEALLGNSDAALSYLTDAVKAGYRNIKHLEGDEDFKSLRDLCAFKELVSAMKSGHHKKFDRKVNQPAPEQPEATQAEVSELKETQSEIANSEEIQPEIANPEEIQQEVAQLEEIQPESIISQAPELSESWQFVSGPGNLTPEYYHLIPMIETLVEMGFSDREDNLRALVSSQGNIAQALDTLINFK